MYVVQKRDSEKSHWHTCNYNGRKCRYSDISKARMAYRLQKENSDAQKHPDRQYRILDTLTNEEIL